jgi:hypothetical protein
MEYRQEILWQRDHADVKGFSSVAVDSQRAIYACGITPDEEHGVVAKYSPGGDLEWTDAALPRPLDLQTYHRVATSAGGDAALPGGERYGAFMDIAVDRNDNVVVAGSFCRTDPLRIYIAVQKYRPDGTVMWSREYMRRMLNHAMGIAVDGDGDIYLVGQGGIGPSLLQPDGMSLKALAMKLSGADGRMLWTRTRKKGRYLWFHDAVLAGDETLAVSGYFLESDVHPVIATFGGRRGFWTRYRVPSRRDVTAAGIARRADGSFHVVGSTAASRVEDIAPYLLRLSSDLSIEWERRGDTNSFLYGTDELPDGTIIASGMHLATSEYYAALYDPASGEKIRDCFLGPVNTSGVNFNDYLKGVAVDGAGDVVLAGAWNPGRVIKVRFTPAVSEGSYTLQVQVQPRDGGRVTPEGGSYPAGSEVTLHAHPARGYTFSHWTGDISDSAATARLTVDEDMSITAHFTERKPWRQDRQLRWLLGGR